MQRGEGRRRARKLGGKDKILGALVVLSFLGGCCAPDTCTTAQSRFRTLEAVTESILAFHDAHGRYPADLDELFSSGVPDGIIKTYTEGRGPLDRQLTYTFEDAADNLPRLEYHSANDLLFPSRYIADRRGGNVLLSFSYVGGGMVFGGMNDCEWTTFSRIWKCSGYM